MLQHQTGLDHTTHCPAVTATVSHDSVLRDLYGDKEFFGEPSSSPCELGAALSKCPFQRLPPLPQEF